MDLISTRGEKAVTPSFAILNGIAKDGGLYVPSFIPKLEEKEIIDMEELDYAERASLVLSKFLTDYSTKELDTFTKKAYDRFDGDPAPVVKIDENTYILELFHGPTLAFKDIALTLLPYLLTSAKKKEGNKTKTLILVATSGDTGKAALEGFSDVEGTEIIVFYPEEGVSKMQKLQMQTTKGENVHVVGINGNFDDAQNAVKTIFNSQDIKNKLLSMGYELSSANSINFGRLVPQIVYYVSTYVDLVASEEIEFGEEINFIVPSGNFGNVLAGYYAKKMGIPIKKLIIASNENKVLTDFFNTGKYSINREFYKTTSPSMDILVSSNLERLLFELQGRNSQEVKDMMSELAQKGFYKVNIDDIQEKLPEFLAYYSTEEETNDAIDNFYDMYDYLLDTHTAVAVSSYYKHLAEMEDDTKTVIVATASPFKFPQDVYFGITNSHEKDAFKCLKKLSNYTGLEIPPQIADLENSEIRHNMVIDKEKIAETIIDILK